MDDKIQKFRIQANKLKVNIRYSYMKNVKSICYDSS